MIHFRTISRALALAAAAAVFASTLHAQADGPPPGPPPGDMQSGPDQGPGVDRQLKRLTKMLTLTADQQAQIKPILVYEQQQIKTLFDEARSSAKSDGADAGGPPSQEVMTAQRTQMKLIREASNTKIAALLTEPQRAKFSTWLEKQKQREAQQGDDMPPPPPDGEGGPPPGGGGPPGV
jgi:Spy/CpxP family protein refolding chaperone